MEPASIGKRIGAFIIDIICFLGVLWLFGQLMYALGDRSNLTLILAITLLPAITALACWMIGNTPGKKMLGLYIVDEETGETPTFWQYIRRSLLFSLLVSFNIVFVIPILVTKKHKAFHDMIAGTVVVQG